MKVVINRCYGGFGLSDEARAELAKRKGITDIDHYHPEYEIDRTDPDLVAVVEAMGRAANGRFSALAVVTIPDDVVYTIEEYDGAEWVAEKHRTWR